MQAEITLGLPAAKRSALITVTTSSKAAIDRAIVRDLPTVIIITHGERILCEETRRENYRGGARRKWAQWSRCDVAETLYRLSAAGVDSVAIQGGHPVSLARVFEETYVNQRSGEFVGLRRAYSEELAY